MTSIVVPNNVTSINDYAFSGCSGLSSVTFHCKSIGTWLRILTSIKEVVFGDEVINFDEDAFVYCTGLNSVISYIKEPFDISDYIFSYETYNNATLYVPIGTTDKYKGRHGWKNFYHIEEGVPSSINDVKISDAEEIGRYTLNGTKASNTHKGVNIVKMSNGTVKKVVVK